MFKKIKPLELVPCPFASLPEKKTGHCAKNNILWRRESFHQVLSWAPVKLNHIRAAGLAALVIGVTWMRVAHWQAMAVVNEKMATQMKQLQDAQSGGIVIQQNYEDLNLFPVWLGLIGLTLFLGATAIKAMRGWRGGAIRATDPP